MDLKDIYIHDSEILSVIENTQADYLDFIISFPIDWERNIFQKKILRFHDYLNYTIKEIPFATQPQILSFSNYEEIEYGIGEGRNRIEIKRKKVTLETNAGSRTLEFNKVELLDFI